MSVPQPTSVDPTRDPVAEFGRGRCGEITPAIGRWVSPAGPEADQVETGQILRQDHEVAPVRDTQCPANFLLGRGAADP